VIVGHAEQAETTEIWDWLSDLREEFNAVSRLAMDPCEDKCGKNIGSDFVTILPIAAKWALFSDPMATVSHPTAIAVLGLPPLYRPMVMGGGHPHFRLQLLTSFENAVRYEKLGKLAVVACQGFKVNIRDQCNNLVAANGKPVADDSALMSMLKTQVPEVTALSHS
jgi:hypothetical protein